MKQVKRIILFVVFISACFMSYDGKTTIENSEVLNLASSGKEVEDLQQRLLNWGFYKGRIDGKYGWDTYLAIRDYQRYSGLKIDGIAGSDTLISIGLTKIATSGVALAEGYYDDRGYLQLLARAINGEARGESYEGQVAVGAVIINRTRDPRFPKTLPGVIYQPGAFTAVSDGQINVPIETKSTVIKAARDALNGWDPTNGCVYYWNPSTATSKWIWSRQIMVKIGKHCFGK